MHYQIAASILSANFAKLGEECRAVLSAGADRIHFDVMDNHYVPNLTMGPLVCHALRRDGITAPIDVHLMVQPVDQLITDFAKAGASIITIHPESTLHLDRSLQLIKQAGCQVGLAFNPTTPLSYMDYVIAQLDEILIMSVNPGFGGQTFIASSLHKIAKAKQKIGEHNIKIAVDGGVNASNIATIAAQGAEIFVMGSAIFAGKNYHQNIQYLRNCL